MSSMERLTPIIRQRVFNEDPLMPSAIWASAYTHLQTDITAKKIDAAIAEAQAEYAVRSTRVVPDVELGSDDLTCGGGK